MSCLVSKSQTIKEHWHVVLVCAIASNARMASVNVDSSGRMGPLIDANTEFHNSEGRSELLHYERLFRPGSINFMSLLGPEIQRSPLTHPQGCLDPSRLWLMQCNGGPSSRQARDGLAFCRENTDLFVDIVFQSILIEMFCVQVLRSGYQ
jgi:hypothetical protein